MPKRFAALSLFVFITASLSAQWNYASDNCENAARKYKKLDQKSTAITTNYSGNPLDADNDNSSVQDIGFDFFYNGAIFKTFVLNTNGFIKLGNTPPSSAKIAYAQALGVGHSAITAPDSNLLYPFNRDMIAVKETYYRLATTGKPGERICTIEFANLADNIKPAQFASISFQVRLYETSNVIEFLYGDWTASAEASALTVAAVGIKGNSTSASVNVMKGSVTEWDLPMGSDNAKPYSFLDGNYHASGPNFGARNTALPDAGRTYRFIPFKSPEAKK
jgi:hypothetical protein